MTDAPASHAPCPRPVPGVWAEVPCGSVSGTRHADGTYVIALADEIDISVRACLDELLAVACTQPGPVVVDTSEVTFMDASGVDQLVRLQRELSPSGRTLVLRAPSAPTRRILELLGLDDLLDVVEAAEQDA
jgi:anti-sigma B factor antagonist